MNMNLCNGEAVPIKHMHPVKFRRLKKMVYSLLIKTIPKDAKILVHLNYYDGTDLLADVYLTTDTQMTFLESVQTF